MNIIAVDCVPTVWLDVERAEENGEFAGAQRVMDDARRDPQSIERDLNECSEFRKYLMKRRLRRF